MTQLKVFLLGSPHIELNGQPLEINRRKALALLLYLVVTGQAHSRDALATMLWPEQDQSRARGSLRRTLSVLNQALKGDWLEIDRENVALPRREQLWLDLEAFRRACAMVAEATAGSTDLSDLAEAVALYRDDFLAGFTLRDSPDFDEWQFFQADQLRSELAGALQRLVEGYTARQEFEPALGYARRWLELDPLNEGVHCQVMLLYAATNQRTAALRQYQTCLRLLADELNLSPSAQTTALYERIRTGQFEMPAAQIVRPANGSAKPVNGHRQSASTNGHAGEDGHSSPPPAPFVAREQELARLAAYFEATLTGSGQIVFVSGEAGSGKTALIQTFARRTQEQHPEVVIALGNCDAHIGPGDPYLPFREILSLLVGDSESRWAQGSLTPQNARRLAEMQPGALDTLARLGPDLIGNFITPARLAQPTGQLATALAGTSIASQPVQHDLYEQLTQVLRALARQRPLLLLIDDAQWADVASINLLFHLSRRLAGSQILLIVTYRLDDVALGRNGERHPLQTIINEIRRLDDDVIIDLDHSQGRHFIEAYLDAEPNRLGLEFREALYRQTQGQPLFTVELLRTMQERGSLHHDAQGRWVAGPKLDWTLLPGRIEAVIAERLSRLDQPLRDLLAVASVEGETFTAQVVAQVQNLSEREVLQALSQAAEQRHLLVREQGEHQVGGQFLSTYQFTHTLFRQYLYNNLSAGERRLLHGEVATTLERLHPAGGEDISVQLAHHYSQAGQIDQAIDYLLKAGDLARNLRAHQAALDFYEQALDFLKRQKSFGRAAQTLMKLGLTHHLAFDFKASHRAYDEGFALWQQANARSNPAPPPAPHPLRVSSNTPPHLDPTLAQENTSGQIISHIFCGLVALTPEMDVVPELAHSWQVLEGGRRYLFHLRDDVCWSDGVPLTAADFVFAWQRTLDPATGSPNSRYLFDLSGAEAFATGQLSDPDQVGVHALDPATLEVNLLRPTGHFPQMLTQWQFYPIPRHAVAAHGPNNWARPEYIVTSGPFNLVDWEPGRMIRLVRNPAYRGSFSGNLAEVEVTLDLSPADQVEFYNTDQLDVLHLYPLSFDLDMMRHRHAAEYFSGPVLHTQYLWFNSKCPPFDDLRVRRAFTMAIDRERLAGVILSGYAYPGTGGFIPPGLPEHSPDIGLPFDPKQARRLLAEAGYQKSEPLLVLTGLCKPGHGPEYQYLQEQWQQQLGVSLTWTNLEWNHLLARLDQELPHMFMMGWSADYPDPDNLLRVGAYQRILSHWYNDRFAQLIEQARRSTDRNERMDLYRQADKILVDEAVVVPLFYNKGHALIKPWVSKYPTSPVNWSHWKDVVIEPHD